MSLFLCLSGILLGRYCQEGVVVRKKRLKNGAVTIEVGFKPSAYYG